jgi:hypothetical protein
MMRFDLGRARAGTIRLALAITGAFNVWAFALAGSAHALPSGCSQSGDTVSCTYTGAGTYAFTVPDGIGSLDVRAVGAGGGAGYNTLGNSPGGPGASVEDTAVPVTAGQALNVVVGGAGGAGTRTTGGAAGSPGGGGAPGDSGVARGSQNGGGGGGYSGVLDPSSNPLVIAAGGGGGGGGSSPGGNGGAGDTGSGGDNGTAGVYAGTTYGLGGGGADGSNGGAAGGAGADCASPFSGGSPGPGSGGGWLAGGQGGTSGGGFDSSGGGGGGGYAGGGGGGGGCAGGGGGGGSSFGITALTNEAIASGPAEVRISYLAPEAQVSPSSLTFATQPQSTLAGPRMVTLTNGGGNRLIVYGLTFGGADAGDFLVTSNGCLGPIASGASCTVGVSFAPQAHGARSATLQIATNDPGSPASISLSGTGGQLPQGASGPPGQVELVTCHKVLKRHKHHKHKVRKCKTRLVSGVVKFRTTPRS